MKTNITKQIIAAMCCIISACVTDPTTGKTRLATSAELAADIQKFQANPQVQQAEKAAGAAALSFIGSAAQNEVAGGAWNSSFAVSAGMNSLAAAVQTLPNSQASQVIEATANNFAATNKTGTISSQALARQLAAAYLAANPQTAAQKTATVVALGTGVNNAAMTVNTP